MVPTMRYTVAGDCQLLVVMTRGYIFATRVPLKRGLCQLEKAAELLRGNPDVRLAIVGGKRWWWIPSEAAVYRDYFVRSYPELKDRIVIVNAQAFVTNRDVLALRDPLKEYLKALGVASLGIGLIGHLDLFSRPRTLFDLIGYPVVHIDSGEPAPTGAVIANERILSRITRVDPFFLWSPLGWAVVCLAAVKRLGVKQTKDDD